MENFTFYNPAQIIFGKGVEAHTGESVKKFGTKVLIHYGGGSIKKNGIYDKVVQSLNDAGVPFIELGGVQPNPRLSLVQKGISLCRENGVDFILAIGGGSAIDSAKTMACGVPYEGDVWDFHLRKASPEKALPIGVVLTIPASGSEMSISSVITNDLDNNYKRGLESHLVIPKFSIINPEFTYSLPPYQTACGITDIMAHLMERYFTQVPKVDLTDRLIEGSLQTVINNGPIVMRNPQDYDARAEICWAGTLAHNTLLNCGRLGDWGSHQIEHELSGIYDIAHGAGLAIIFPAWMRYVYKERVTLFVQFAMRVFGVNLPMENPEAIALEGIQRLENFYRSIGMPTRLSEAGIGSDRLREMAERVVKFRPYVGAFKKLYADDIEAILKLAL